LENVLEDLDGALENGDLGFVSSVLFGKAKTRRKCPTSSSLNVVSASSGSGIPFRGSILGAKSGTAAERGVSGA